ncbi:hypothetical protein Tco_0927710 [Tanacetum coccineum]
MTSRLYALSWKPCQGDSLNLPDHRIHKDGDGDASFQLKSGSITHMQKESKYMDKEIDLEKKIKGLDNIVYKVGQSAQIVHMLTKPQVFYNDTHKQALGYQNLFYLKKSQWIKPTLYDGSVISSQHAVNPVIDDEETLILEEFDTVVKKRITPDAITEGEWGFEHKKAIFLNEVILFLKTLKDIFNVFEKDLLDEITKVQTVFNQMEAAVQQCSCLDLDAELLNKQNVYSDLLKSYSQLEKHCISLELTTQLNQEIFQKDTSSNNQNALEILEYFENNDLKAQLYAKDTTICQIQEKVFVPTTLQNELRKLKGKNVLDNSTTITNATTFALGMLKLDLDPLAPRITLTKVVPIKETISHLVETQKPEIKVYSRRPKQVKSVSLSKKAKIVESKIANNSEPNHSWGSNATDVPSSSSLFNDRNDQIAKIMGYGSRDPNLYTISIDDMLKTSPIYLLLKASKTKTCALGKSKKSSYQPKAEDTNQEKSYLLHRDLYGPMRVESINGKNSGPGLQLMTHATSSFGLVPNLIPQQPCNPPTRNDWDCLFQPMFDENFNPPTSVVSPVLVGAAPRAVDIADLPVSTLIDQDAPSISIPSTQEQEQSPIISQGVEESPKTPHFNDDPLHEDSTSQ